MNRIQASALLMGLGVMAASCVEVRDPGVQGPADNGDFSVSATAGTESVFEGGSVQLSAAAEGGSGNYVFLWDQNSGPAVEIEGSDAAEASVPLLAEPGHYVFRVTVTDSDGRVEVDLAPVDVLSAVEIQAPDFVIVDQPATLSAQLPADSPPATFFWEIVQGDASLNDPALGTVQLFAERGETVKVRLTVTFEGGERPVSTREIDLVAVSDLSPQVRVETSMGDFVIELDGQNTPRHMVNFLRYVDEGFYEGLLFHRNSCNEDPVTQVCEPFVLQGGGYRREGEELVLVEPTHEPVAQENETSQSSGVLYTVALALRGNPNSGTTQFFINLDTDNDFLDNAGFTVFGRVVEGTDVVDAMAATERVESPIIDGEDSLPAVDIVIERIVRVE